MAVFINQRAYERARKGLGLSHSEVARRTGVTYGTLRKWFNGVRFPSSVNQDRLAKALGLEPAKLFRFDMADDEPERGRS